MREQSLNPLMFARLETHHFRPQAFVFRDDRPAHWLQRLCLWVLKKLECYDRFEEVTFEPQKIDVLSIYNAVKTQADFVAFHADRPRTLVIGRDAYTKLIGEAPPEYFTMHIGEFMDMSVLVVPWCNGFCVIDKEIRR